MLRMPCFSGMRDRLIQALQFGKNVPDMGRDTTRSMPGSLQIPESLRVR